MGVVATVLLVWLAGIVIGWLLCRPIVGQSRCGLAALPVVAVLWPVFLILTATFGVVGLVDWWIEDQAGDGL